MDRKQLEESVGMEVSFFEGIANLGRQWRAGDEVAWFVAFNKENGYEPKPGDPAFFHLTGEVIRKQPQNQIRVKITKVQEVRDKEEQDREELSTQEAEAEIAKETEATKPRKRAKAESV